MWRCAHTLFILKGTDMINRYTRPAMGKIWELENKFSIWKEIEVLA